MSEAAGLQIQTMKTPPAAASSPLLQRKCACSGTSGLTGSCADCEKHKLNGKTLQTKLRINDPGDEYEKQADRVAEEVLAAPAQNSINVTGGRIQRLAGPGKGQIYAPPASVTQCLASPGEPLEPALRREMERRFGYDFSRVRVHSGAAAERSARDVNALAYTVGHDIVFGAGSFAPKSVAGQRLLAHELTHVVQQSGSERSNSQAIHNQPVAAANDGPKLAPAAYSLRINDEGGGEKFIGPPIPDVSGAAPVPKPHASELDQTGREEDESESLALQRRSANGAPPTLFLQRTATFTKPVPKPEDPLARMLKGLTPGLTTPELNGTKSPSLNQLVTGLQPINAKQTGSSGGSVSCQFDGLQITTTAEQIVSTAAPKGGWSTSVGPASALSSEPKCAAVAKLPLLMNALPDNTDFVKRVQRSEDEHVADLKWLHDRYLVAYDAFATGLVGTGKDLPACGQDLMGKLGTRATEAGYNFVHGWKASLEKLDGPLGTHTDTANIATNKDCSGATLTVNAPAAMKPKAGPGNVAVVNPTVTKFSPAKLKVAGSDLKEDKKTVKSFSNAAAAKAALAVIQHYGMTSRNVVGSLEYFLVGGAAPSGALKGANEVAIDPKRFQVTFDFPNAGEWTIADIGSAAGAINVNLIASFGANRDQAYSAWSILHAFGFTWKGWVGGTRQKPEMLYFRV